ncbi:MAG: hypothetical protein AB7H97_11110 [Pseudobdellovibrionaceae bacterium]
MKTNQKLPALVFSALAVFLTSACERASDNSKKESKIEIQFPKIHRKAGTLSSDKRICYGIEINQTKIAKSTETTCAPALGQTIGFIEEGKSTEISLDKASDYQFNLYAYVIDSTESCPAGWGAEFNTTGNNFGRLYKIASTTKSLVNDTETIDLQISSWSIRDSVLAKNSLKACNHLDGPDLIARLYSNGDIRNKNGSLFKVGEDLSAPNITSLSKIDVGQNENTGISYTYEGGRLSDSTISAPPYVRSITRKPDSKDYFGLIEDGTIVEVLVQTGAVVPLTETTCPFSYTSCKVPVWIQSISAGLGTQLFALDHSGQIYMQENNGNLTAVSTTVEPSVDQVVYY